MIRNFRRKEGRDGDAVAVHRTGWRTVGSGKRTEFSDAYPDFRSRRFAGAWPGGLSPAFPRLPETCRIGLYRRVSG